MSNPARDLVEALRALALELPSEARIGFVAALERGAAQRYRRWAEAADSPFLAAGRRT